MLDKLDRKDFYARVDSSALAILYEKQCEIIDFCNTHNSKEETNYRKLHDKICQTCDGCTSVDCAFTRGYNRSEEEKPKDWESKLKIYHFVKDGMDSYYKASDVRELISNLLENK